MTINNYDDDYDDGDAAAAAAAAADDDDDDDDDVSIISLIVFMVSIKILYCVLKNFQSQVLYTVLLSHV